MSKLSKFQQINQFKNITFFSKLKDQFFLVLFYQGWSLTKFNLFISTWFSVLTYMLPRYLLTCMRVFVLGFVRDASQTKQHRPKTHLCHFDPLLCVFLYCLGFLFLPFQ